MKIEVKTLDKVYCFFSARYLPCLGGVERYTYNLAKELTQKGNKVFIVTSLIGNELEYEERDEAIVYRLPSINLMGGRFPITITGKKYKSIKNALKHANIDYIIVNTRFYFLSYLGAMFSKRNGIPAIVIEHGTGHFTVNNSIIDFFGRAYEHFISNLVKKNVHNFYGVSEACVDWLKHFGINGKGTLFNAIDINMIGELYNKSNITLEKKVRYSSDDYIITYTGRLIKEKGILKLIEAFRKVKSKYPQVKLCIAGDGDLYDSITDEEGIYKLGRLSFEDVIGLLQLSKI